MVIKKEVKKLFGKLSRKDVTSQSMASTGAQHGRDHVDLGLVSDGILFAEDFKLWFGRSTFEGTLAKIVQKEYPENRTFSLMDVRELVANTYAQDVTGLNEGDTDSQTTSFSLYSLIYSTRCNSDDGKWEDFCRVLSSRISTSCARLRNEKIPELHADSVPRLSENSPAPTPRTNGGGEAYASPSPSPSGSPSVSPHRQPVVESSVTMTPPQAQQTLQPLANPATVPGTVVDMHKYTSALKEHGDSHGTLVAYQKRSLNHYPPSWQCVATFGDVTGEGIARNSQQAKHIASKQVCEMLGLFVG